MGKISISIRNEHGVNKLKGNNLSNEETLALIELAKEIVYPSTNFHELAQPLMYPPVFLGGIETGAFNVPCGQEDCDCAEETTATEQNSSDMNAEFIASRLSSPLNRAVKPSNPTVDDEATAAPVSTATTNLGDKLSQAFSNKFPTPPTDPSEDKSILSTEERLEELNKNYYETGVKHKLYGNEITPFYRLRWSCPKCGGQGNHYVPENVKNTFCYDCNAALLARPANVKFPNRDEWGNFFVADELNLKYLKA